MAKFSGHGYFGFSTSGAGMGLLRVNDIYNATAFPIPAAVAGIDSLMDSTGFTTNNVIQAGTLLLMSIRKT